YDKVLSTISPYAGSTIFCRNEISISPFFFYEKINMLFKSTLAAALLLEVVFSHFLHQQIDI
ncbi:hypothetical protein, partial [Bacillus smithii]|uniref:hypothetical protein n=1 Tax=Bacillus smithii TaxID=1479 RepID=UPI0030C9B351